METKHTFTLFFAIALTVLSFSGFSQKQLIKVNGFDTNIYTMGLSDREPEEPVLVFENGWGMDLNNWKGIAEGLSASAPLILYDRAGIGASDENDRFPNLKNRAEHLKNLLISLNVPPPYILVGHSLGGVYIRGYAGHYPEDVAGLVFIDPADFTETKEQWKIPLRNTGVPEKMIDEMLYKRLYSDDVIDPDMPKVLREERQALKTLRKTDYVELRAIPLPKVPIVFFVGGRFYVPEERRIKDFDHEAYFQNRILQWISNWNRVIRETGAGGFLVYCANAAHFVHHDEPWIVINNIKTLLEAIKK